MSAMKNAGSLPVLFAATVAFAAAPGAQERTELARTTVAVERPQPADADLVLHDGFVYTVDGASSVASAVAIRDGVILYVGDDAGAARYVGPGTELVDLDGRMAMPGIHDSHMHPLEAFHEATTCILPTGSAISSYGPALASCAAASSGNWLIGYGHSIFDMHMFLESGGDPLAVIDAAVPGKPAVILEETSHSVWVNSLALQAAGIDATTPDPFGGVILHDSMGDPNGVLLDAAGEIVMDLAFTPTPRLEQQNYDALLAALPFANRNGITSLVDARCYWSAATSRPGSASATRDFSRPA